MFGTWGHNSDGPIGLDLGAYSIKMLQLRVTTSGWVAKAGWQDVVNLTRNLHSINH